MKLHEVIMQLESLRSDRESFLTGNDDDIYIADIEALGFAVDQLKGNPIQAHWSSKQESYQDGHGDFHFGYVCSNCGSILNRTLYCGACGAKMDGGN